MRLIFWTSFWVFLIDQLSKYLVVQRLDLKTLQVFEVWPPFITFHMAWNKGINFGLFSGLDMRWVLIALALFISGLVLYWMRNEGQNKRALIAAGFLVGGALGNVVDRLIYGAVADFLNISCCGLNNPYAFNVADISVFAGALGLVLFSSDGAKKRGDHKTS